MAVECPFDLTNKRQVIEFEETDPYNPHNIVKGYINRRQGQLYGALWITHINGEKCEQLIYSAPKQHYPFNKDKNGIREWEFPECDYVELYEKLDGTCIISYVYKDCNDAHYLTFKTRLRPFLGEGKYGNFFQLWNEMLEKYPSINNLCSKNYTYNFVFELYGKRNKILIDYDVSLDTKLIFIVDRNDGRISPPTKLVKGLPVLKVWGELEYGDIDSEDYLDIQKNLEDDLIVDEENKILKGMEGLVWYFIKDNCAKQIECKPPSILKYHWSGDAIPYESIFITVINAFENFDEPTFDDVVELLLEEFDESKIEKSNVRIKKILKSVFFDKKLQYKLAEDYKKHGFNINEDKVTCMRWFGVHYPKDLSTKIYQLLKSYEDKKSD